MVDHAAEALGVGALMDLVLASPPKGEGGSFPVAEVGLPRQQHRQVQVRRVQGTRDLPRVPVPASREDVPDRHRLGGSGDPVEDLADPGVVVPDLLPAGQSVLGPGTVPLHDLPELVPAGVAPVPLALLLVPCEVGVGDRDPEVPQLRHVGGEEFLAEVLVRSGLDAPVQEDILLGLRRRAEEVHDRPPPPIHRILEHLALLGGAADELERELLAVAEVHRLLGADPTHRPDVWEVRAVEERLLGDQRGAVDQPADHGHVAPRLGRVVEHVVELGPPVDEVVPHVVAALAEVLGHPVQDLGVPSLILHLRGQGQLPLQRGRPRNPLALGEATHHLGIRVHLDELQQRGPILIGHPLAGLDLLAAIDPSLELGHPLLVAHRRPSFVLSPASRRSVNRSATSSGESGPSGRYHVYVQFAAESTRSLANRGSVAPGRPRTMSSHSRSYRRRSRRIPSWRSPVRAFHSWWNAHAASTFEATTPTWARMARRSRCSGVASFEEIWAYRLPASIPAASPISRIDVAW